MDFDHLAHVLAFLVAFDFERRSQVLQRSHFVLTDSGGLQEEVHFRDLRESKVDCLKLGNRMVQASFGSPRTDRKVRYGY